ncbi:MAG: bifunctional 3-deoxy-7-phosphoheptulonate synthase/chorismate mutase [Planctomycetes bacterium]|nr:bifunctional 3-deoxy-7-phosphoheptulonate synthase/chorismate mutase [Planctomycetota bacterium]
MTSQTATPAAGDAALVLAALRGNISRIDNHLLELLAERSRVAADIGLAKRLSDRPLHDAGREREHARLLGEAGSRLGLPGHVVRRLYLLLAGHAFDAQLPLPEPVADAATPPDSDAFRLARLEPGRPRTVVRVGEAALGAGTFEVIGGPCAVESARQVQAAADHARACGVRIMRGGAFKPRTSPYEFQGLGLPGLALLAEAAHSRGMAVVTEVLDPAHAADVAAQADMLQIGARNMQNVPLLRACARTGRPVMLKRGAGATLREWLCAAEYLLLEGNPDVVLCERGIRTWERETRNTLDLSAVVAMRRMTHLPVMVDPSHAAGRNELILPLCRGAHAVGADGVIVEMHPCPAEALCDRRQALSPAELRAIATELHLKEVMP